jgi:hypothetical protein
VGVSACATTALWSSFQKLRVFEEIGKATPAQITMVASSYTLPFGRSMPSEGLSVDQMCQAVQAVGLSPNLYRTDSFNWARQLIFAAAKSAFAPILIINRDESWHAVTVAGAKLKSLHESTIVEGSFDDMSSNLTAVYIHDDRKGPYIRAEVVENNGGMELLLKKESHLQSDSERWNLAYVLVPTHSKIRLTFGGLRDIAILILKSMYSFHTALGGSLEFPHDAISLECWIQLGHSYVRNLFVNNKQIIPEKIIEISRKISMPRYVGIISIRSSFFNSMDILIDTTCTRRNPYFIGIIEIKNSINHTSQLSTMLSVLCRCPIVKC